MKSKSSCCARASCSVSCAPPSSAVPPGIVDARAVERLAGREDARADPHAGFDRLAIFLRLERIRRRIPHARDAERQPDAAERLAVALRQVRVAFDQSRQHGAVRRIDDRARVQIGAMRLDARDAVALDHDVDVLAAPSSIAPSNSRPACTVVVPVVVLAVHEQTRRDLAARCRRSTSTSRKPSAV